MRGVGDGSGNGNSDSDGDEDGDGNNNPDSACVGSFYPTKEFHILRGISARVLDRLRVKDIFWIFLDLCDLLDLFSLSIYDSLSVLTPATCL